MPKKAYIRTMGVEYSEIFDLPILLRQGNLDIRGVASKNMALQVGEYFDLLSKYMIREPEVMDTLIKIGAFEDDAAAFKTLADVKILLEQMGAVKLATAFSEIIDAGKKNDKKLAAVSAKKISEDFYTLFNQIIAAKKTETEEKPGTVPDENDPSPEKPIFQQTHSLNNALKTLEQAEATRKLRILAIDDAPVMLKTISSVLGDEYKVYGMTNPKMLEKFLTHITPELFLLDYQMPDISGFDLVPIIRNFEEHKNTPIIFITSQGTPDHVSAALTLGACDFIVKPFQGNILRAKIAKHIVRKRLF